MWHEILWLSPLLFWLGLFTHRAFSSAQDDDTRGRVGSHLGDTLHVLELAVLYYDTSSPLKEGVRQRRRMDPRSSVKNYVRLSVFLERHPDRSRRSFVVWKRRSRLHTSLPKWGRLSRSEAGLASTHVKIPLREPTSALSGHLLPKEGGRKEECVDW